MSEGRGTQTTSAASDAGQVRRWQLRIFVATWLAYAGYYFCRKAFYVVKKDMGQALGLDSMALAQVGTAYLVGYMLGQFSSAYFGRRFGPKRLLLVGMGISLVCNAIFGAANGLWTIALFMALNGMAQGTGWPGCIGSLGFWFKREERGTVLGVWATCYQVGSVVASAAAAFWLGHLGWRWSFFGASLALLAAWALVLWLHPDTPEKVGLAPVADDEDGVEDTHAAPMVPGTAAVQGKPLWSKHVVVTVLLMGCIYFCIKFLRYALWSWTPYFLAGNYHLQGDSAGYWSTVFDLCGFAGVLISGYLSDKVFHGRRALISLVMLVGMAGAFWAMYGLGDNSLIAFAIALGVAGFMLYGPDALLSGVGAIDVATPRTALVAAGIINGMGSVGPIFQEQLVGLMYERSGHQLAPIFALFMGMAVLAALLAGLLLWRARHGEARV